MKLPLPAEARLRVSLDVGDGRPLELLGLARAARVRVAAEWTSEALSSGDDAGANLVNRQLPHVQGVHLVGKPALDGLPGFLADSLPDSWGRLLIDRQLRQLGIQPRSLSGFDRLAVVGDRGPGALVFAPVFPLDDGDNAPEPAHLDLDRLAEASALVLAGDDASVLADLARAGGSAGGSRPKAWVAVDAVGRLRSGASSLQPGETGWLVKFRAPRHDPEDVGPFEYAYAQMAAAAGLDVAEPHLFETARGGRYFGSRRFDRGDGARVHVLTAAGLLDVAGDEAVAADYGDLLALTRRVTRSEQEVIAAYRHAVFNVMAHNRDDHLKQFAFRRSNGAWTRTPVYDLTFSDGPAGEHTLLVAGEGKRPTHGHLVALAERANIKPPVAKRVRREVTSACAEWRSFAKAAGVSASSTNLAAAWIDAWE